MITNINVGLTANDGLGDKLRDAFIIVNQNFLDIQDILDVVLTDSSIISISQISGLQTILDDINYQVSLIPGLQDDINSINSIIYTINQTLNSQNGSISDLYSLVNDLQQQIYTKIGDAPIDGEQYVRQDGEWVISTGVTFSQLLENVTPDGYLGLRLQPASASNNGFYINKSTNQSVGYYARNTDNVGNAAVSALYLGGSGGLYDNYVSLFHANAGYSIPYLSNKNGLISNNDLFFIGWQGASFDFVTSTGTFGSETSKFRITNSGTVSIGVTPSLDNTTTDILGRKADGTIVRIDKSSIPVLSLDELTDVTIIGTPSNNSLLVYGTSSVWKNKSLEELGSTTNLISDGLPGTAVTGSTNQIRVLVKSYLIPANTFAVGDIMEFWAFGSKVGSATAWYVGCSINTSNTLSGSTELVRSYSNNAWTIYLPLQRVVNFPTASTLKVSNQTNTLEGATGFIQSTITFDTTIDNYLLFTVTPVTGGTADLMNIEKVIITKSKYKPTI